MLRTTRLILGSTSEACVKGIKQVANWLAMWARRDGIGVLELASPLEELVTLLDEDARGVMYPRVEHEEINC